MAGAGCRVQGAWRRVRIRMAPLAEHTTGPTSEDVTSIDVYAWFCPPRFRSNPIGRDVHMLLRGVHLQRQAGSLLSSGPRVVSARGAPSSQQPAPSTQQPRAHL